LTECQKKRDNLLNRLELASKEHTSDVIPNKNYDFIKLQRDIFESKKKAK